jgi:hypothetical protein
MTDNDDVTRMTGKESSANRLIQVDCPGVAAAHVAPA